MPFPLAHPAVVLPLRRYCPRYLNLPALMIGSLSPDLGYLFGKLNVESFSHRWVGSFGFCLPMSVLMLLAFTKICAFNGKNLPPPYNKIVEPLGRLTSSWEVIIVSLLVGIWSHLIWDSFTHKDGWLVERVPLLYEPMFLVGTRKFRVCHLFWYLSTFVGILTLCAACQRWLYEVTQSKRFASRRKNWYVALAAGLLILPVAAVHHVSRSLFVALIIILAVSAAIVKKGVSPRN